MLRFLSRPPLRLLAGAVLGGAAASSLVAAGPLYAAAPAPPPAGPLDPNGFRSFKLKSRAQASGLMMRACTL